MSLTHVEATDSRFEVIYESVLKHFHELDEEEPDNSTANLVSHDGRRQTQVTRTLCLLSSGSEFWR